jgi:hypothetical protein
MFMRYIALLLIALAVATAVGCGESGLARAPVRGQILLAGQPLKQGRILFTPQAPNTGPVASAVVVNGAYQLSAQDGPVLGNNRVQVEATPDLGFALDDEAAFAKRGPQPLPPDPIPPEFGSQSTLTKDIQAGDNQFDVQIPAAAKRW